MSGIKARNTGPELLIRKRLHALGFRYRIHAKNISGRPDIALAAYRAAVFVNGCFWHGHEGCRRAAPPKTRREYWTAKIERNRRRDQAQQVSLRKLGWDVLVVWECELRAEADLIRQVREFLDRSEPSPVAKIEAEHHV